ncbi:MAG: DegT/DnrJ/EryC1/StrS family aminotransferase [Brevinema sp.]
MTKRIEFSPPTLSEDDIQAVVEVLRSGWITTGSTVKQFEAALSTYTNSNDALCLNSATAGLYLALKSFGIGEGDEVITTPYTFAATANAILHTGAKVVFADVLPHSFFISPQEIARKITPRTKAVIPVNFGGGLADYASIMPILKEASFTPKNTLQEMLGRPLLVADSAHSLGASGIGADVESFSFHAVKNLTTAEGGAMVSHTLANFTLEFMKQARLYALHGQNKSAKDKFSSACSWEYDILVPGYKFNMPDVLAALGMSQLKRYESTILPHRRRIFEIYNQILKEDIFIKPNLGQDHTAHLYPLRIENFTQTQRNTLISQLFEHNICTNVHYKPLTLMTASTFYGDHACPHAETQWINEISLPIHGKMSDDDAHLVAETLKKLAKTI